MLPTVLTVVSLVLLVLLSAGSTAALIVLWTQARSYRQALEYAQGQNNALAGEASAARAHLVDIAEALKTERKMLDDFKSKQVVAILSEEQIRAIIAELKIARTKEEIKNLPN
jgi:hypothetical protein